MNDAPFCLVVNIGVQLVMFVGALLNTYLGTKSMSIPFLVKTNQFEEVAQARECALADMIPIVLKSAASKHFASQISQLT